MSVVGWVGYVCGAGPTDVLRLLQSARHGQGSEFEGCCANTLQWLQLVLRGRAWWRSPSLLRCRKSRVLVWWRPFGLRNLMCEAGCANALQSLQPALCVRKGKV